MNTARPGANRLLDGVTVAEHGHSVATRYAGRLLADLGASVGRASGAGPATSVYDEWLDRGKLAAVAAPDIVLTEDPTQRGGRVRVVIEPFGEGPYAEAPFAGIVAFALSGWLSITGVKGGPPVKPSLPLPSVAAGASAAAAGVFMLLGQERGQPGATAHVSIVDTMFHMLGPWPLHYPMLGNIPARADFNGYRFGMILPARDGYVLTTMVRQDWELVGALLDAPRLQEPRWKNPEHVLDHRQELQEILAAGLAGKVTTEVVADAVALGLPWAAVSSAGDILSCPQLESRGFWQPWQRPDGTDVPGPGLPFDLAREIEARTRSEKRPVEAPGSGPLSGLTVVELTVAWAGPFAGRVLVDAGATVVKVESGRKPDTARGVNLIDTSLSERWWDRSMACSVPNADKHHVGLEVDTSDGREALVRLVRQADVLINNHSPRVLRNLGIDFDDLARVNPELVYLTSTGFGYGGPFQDRVSLGWTIDAMCGISANMGFPGSEPVFSRMPFPDVFAGLHGALAVGAALLASHERPAARWVDLSQYECGVHAAAEATIAAAAGEGERGRIGNRHPVEAPHGVYPAAGEDEWVALAVTSDEQWAALAGVIGCPGRATTLPSHALRYEHHDAVDAAIADWTQTQTRVSAETALRAAGVPAAAVLNGKEVFEDPHHRRRNYACAANDECGPRAWPARWNSYDGQPPALRWASPRFGEHNDLVFGQWLGFDAHEIARMRANGTIADRPLFAFIPANGGLTPARQVELGEIAANDPDYLARVAEFCAGDGASGRTP